jgi:hypothetical protein
LNAENAVLGFQVTLISVLHVEQVLLTMDMTVLIVAQKRVLMPVSALRAARLSNNKPG